MGNDAGFSIDILLNDSVSNLKALSDGFDQGKVSASEFSSGVSEAAADLSKIGAATVAATSSLADIATNLDVVKSGLEAYGQSITLTTGKIDELIASTSDYSKIRDTMSDDNVIARMNAAYQEQVSLLGELKAMESEEYEQMVKESAMFQAYATMKRISMEDEIKLGQARAIANAEASASVKERASAALGITPLADTAGANSMQAEQEKEAATAAELMATEQAKYAASAMAGAEAAQRLVNFTLAGADASRQIVEQLKEQVELEEKLAEFAEFKDDEQAKYAAAAMVGEEAAQRLVNLTLAGADASRQIVDQLKEQVELEEKLAKNAELRAEEEAKYAAASMMGDDVARKVVGNQSSTEAAEASSGIQAQMQLSKQMEASLATEQTLKEKIIALTDEEYVASQKINAELQVKLGLEQSLVNEELKKVQTKALAAAPATPAVKEQVAASLGLNGFAQQAEEAAAETTVFAAAEERLTITSGTLSSALRGAAKGIGGMGMMYGQIIPMMTAFAAAATLKSSIDLGQQFEYDATFVETFGKQAGQATLSTNELKEALLSMTGVTQNIGEMAAGMKVFAQSGVPEETALKQLPELCRFATVAEQDLGTAIKETTKISDAFGVSQDEVANKIVVGAAQSASTVKGTEDALSKMTALGTVAKYSLDESITMLATIGKFGVTDSEAGTAARTALMKLLTLTPAVTEDFRKMKVSWTAFDDAGNQKPLLQMLQELSDLTSRMTQGDRATVFKDMFSLKGGMAGGTAVSGFKDMADQVKDLYNNVQHAGDGISVLQKETQDLSSTGQYSMELVKKSFSDAMTAAYDTSPAVTELYKTLQEIGESEGFRNFLKGAVQGFFELSNELVQVATGFGPIIEGVGAIGSAAGTLLGLGDVGEWGIVGVALFAGGPAAALIVDALMQINKLMKEIPQVGGGSLDDSIGDLMPKAKATTDAFIALYQSVVDVSNGIKDVDGKPVDEVTQKFNSLTAEIANLKAQLADKSGFDMDPFNLGITTAQDNTEKLKDKLADLEVQLDRINKVNFTPLGDNLAAIAGKIGISAGGYGVEKPGAYLSKNAPGAATQSDVDHQNMLGTIAEGTAKDKALKLAGQMDAVRQKELASLKAFEESKLAIQKAANDQSLEIDKEGYEWGTVTLEKYLADKHQFSQETADADVAAKQKELDNAKEMAGQVASKMGAKGQVDVAGSMAAQFEAQTKVYAAEKALTDAQSKADLLKKTNLNESREMLDTQRIGYENTNIALLTLTGHTYEAQVATDNLYKVSKEYKALNLEAASGNPLAQKAKASTDQAMIIKEQNAKNNQDLPFAQDTSSLQAYNSEWEDYYNTQVKILQIQLDLATAANKPTAFLKVQLEDAKKLASGGMETSFMKGMQDISKTWTDKSKNMVQVGTDTANAMQQGFSSIFFDTMQGKFKGLASYINSFMASVEQSVSNLLSKQLAGGLMNAFGSSGGGGSSALSGIGNSIANMFGGGYTANAPLMPMSAQGNVFTTSPDLSAHSNSIVSMPTMFKFASGAGIMGEAGPEAIMPLTRGTDGNLGVRSSGNTGGMVVNIHNHGDSKVSAKKSNDGMSLDVMVEQVESAVSKRMSRGSGLAPFLDGRYGRRNF